MPLTHVSMWTDNGFQPTTPNQAAKIHPYGASSRSGLFVCRLCGQYVSFVQNSYNTHFFKHSRGEEDKDCSERSIGASGSVTIKMKQQSLPIRLTVHSANSFSLALGIVLPSGASVPNQIIQISAEEFKQPYIFRTEQLVEGNVTYLSIRQDLAPRYTLTLRPNTDTLLSKMVPTEVEGIPSEGCLFQVESAGNCGKKVPQGANILVHKDYFILSSKDLYLSDSLSQSIRCDKICKCSVRYHSWYVFRVRALQFNEVAAEYFLQFRCILTESTVSLIPVWPIHRSSPYISYHNSSNIWFYLEGQDVSAQTYPSASILSYECERDSDRVLNVYCGSRQQTLLAGKSKILRYTYLWREQLITNAEQPAVAVSDLNGNPIPMGESTQLPHKRILRIQAPFDGKVLIRKNGQFLEKRFLKAKEAAEVDQIGYGMEIQVLQGLDIVWSICFRAEHSQAADDELIYQQLAHCRRRSVPFPHRYGIIANYIHEMPKTLQWIRTHIRNGVIPEDALKIVQKMIHEKRESHG